MNRLARIMIAAGLGLAAAGGAAFASAAMQSESPEQLRATGLVGEKADGYMGLVGSAPAELRSRVDAINIQRRAHYTELARQRSATIEEVARSTACEIFASRILAGQYYQLPDGVWRRRNGDERVPRPTYCG